MEASTVTIPDGDAGTFATLDHMRALANNRCSHPHIRNTAMRVAGLARTPGERIERLRAWLRSTVRFVPDPDVTELLHDPVLLLQWIERDGTVGVDCDDVAMLAAALGKSLGIPARFVVVGFFVPDAPFGHVWTELFDGEVWRELDTTRRVQGIEDGRISRRAVVDVATGERGDTMSGMVTRRRIGAFPARRRSLGIEPVTTIATATTLIQTLGPLIGSTKEPGRIEANRKAEQLALAGNDFALEFLRCRSIQGVVCGELPGYGAVGGWATATARADAGERYNNVRAQRASGNAPIGGTTTVTTPVGAATLPNSGLLLAAGLAFMLLRK